VGGSAPPRGVLSAAAQVPPALGEREPLATLTQQIRALVFRLIARGQELGMIRTDLPEELLFAWMQALDRASDRWLLAHWVNLDRATVARVSDETVAAMRRVLAPLAGRPGGER
jgi:hypothetical protein